MSLERAQKHPLRYAPVWAMTLARPVLGQAGLIEARRGNWSEARKNFIAAYATDMEGYVARPLNAASDAGAVADPVADGVLRVQSIAAFAPHMTTSVTASIALIEAHNLQMNSVIQRGKSKPEVPKGAKWGSAIEAVGATLFMHGMKENNKSTKIVGEATMVAGAITRHRAYRRLYKEGERT